MYGINPVSINKLLRDLHQLRHENIWGALQPLRLILSPSDLRRYQSFIGDPLRNRGEYTKGYTRLMFEGIDVIEAEWVKDGEPVAAVLYRGGLERYEDTLR